jgi:hypothetical protein
MRLAALRWTALLVLLAGCAQGEQQTVLAGDPPRQAQSDPATWNTYLRAAAAADRIEDVVERCHSYPDLPGNHWPMDSGRARCGRLADALPTLAEIESLLADEDGVARLERGFAQRLEAHYRDPAQRESIFRAYQDFSSDDDSRRVAELWLARSPASGFARMAMGRYLVTAAGEARGDKRIAETPGANLHAMRRLMAQGVTMLQAALEAQPRLSPACADLMFAARLAADDALRDSATARCLETDPLSWSVRFQWLMQKDPRWGGSFEELDAAIDEIRSLVPRNPALGAMLARGIGLRAYLSYLNDVPLRDLSAAFDRASQVGPDPLFIGYAGLAAKTQGDLHKALGYLSQGLRFAPGDSRFLGARADVRMKLQDFDGAAADARRAIELDDSLGRNHTVLGQSLAKLGRVAEAREAYLRAMQFPKQRQWAFRRWCETYILGGVQRDEALACTQGMISEYPDDAEALFMRSWVLYELKDPAAAEVAARFHAVADMDDRRQRQMASELARIAK